MRSLLDTSVLISDRVLDIPGPAAISAASLAELHFGVHLAKDPTTQASRLRRLGVIESTFKPLPIDDAVARAYGELASITVRAGRKVRARVMDLLIAATARAHDSALYTLNYRDFTPYSELIDIRDASL